MSPALAPQCPGIKLSNLHTSLAAFTCAYAHRLRCRFATCAPLWNQEETMSFNDLGLQDTLLQAVNDSGYTTPTPIQLRAIPAILTGKDVMAAAQTGTGKTAG